MLETDKVFAGSVPENYDRYMVPLIFEPYAADFAQRAASFSPSAVLEIAAGNRLGGAISGIRTEPRATHVRAVDSAPDRGGSGGLESDRALRWY